MAVFAAELIAQRTLLWRLNPIFDVFVRESDLIGLPPHTRGFLAHYSYPHLELPSVMIVDSDNGRFMNHSDAPNTNFIAFPEGYAIRDIAEGDELTCNYADFDPTFKGFSPKGTEMLPAGFLHSGSASGAAPEDPSVQREI